MSITEETLRRQFISYAINFAGTKEGSESFAIILRMYNDHKPLARGYTVKAWDEWCATYVSAMAIGASKLSGYDYLSIMPTECGCNEMVKLYQAHNKSEWEEDDAYVPKIGDIIMYAWKDSETSFATTDCMLSPNHVGIVTDITKNQIMVLEGNKGEKVAFRTIKVNDRYIRGYCCPNYAALAKEINDKNEEENPMVYTTTEQLPKWAKEMVLAAMQTPSKVEEGKHVINGDGNNSIYLTDGDLRTVSMLYHAGVLTQSK